MARSASGTTDLAPCRNRSCVGCDRGTCFVTGRGEPLEALEAICEDGGTDRDVSRDEPPYRNPGEVGNDLHSDSARCRSTSLDGDQDQGCLASLELAAAPKPCLGSAHPRLVKFNLAPKRLPSRVHHRSTKFVENHPCGFVSGRSRAGAAGARPRDHACPSSSSRRPKTTS